ncbi:AIPR family protein [Shewanella algae]|uniref:AIPR family protein n=1 Tax=Shewanella algae TaxID=38313 RepID=UPI001AADFBAE|nr:AIPR family protein [Shewanella algae]MBO2566350.1 AIPR family protein [Shewanella algae]
MHRIIKTHLNKFLSEKGIEEHDISKQFEYFVNYCVVSRFFSGKFDVFDITTSDEDAGIDGVAVIADGELITTVDEIDALFSSHKRSIEIEFVFIQTKTSDKFEKKEITNFGDGVFDFSDEKPEFPHDEILTEANKIFESIIENVDKVKNGKPNATTYYVTTGVWKNERELVAALKTTQKKVKSTGYYNEVSSLKIDRDELIKIWSSIHQPVEAVVKVKGYVPYNEMPGVEESYIAIIPAKNYIDSLLLAEDGKMRSGIFDENVRAYLGEDNDVNKKIKSTLEDESFKEYFALLNNGITIVSPDIRVQSDSISLSNYQIVNGCQSSHVLFRNRELLNDSTMVTAKVIEVVNPDIVNKIVEATNNQSHVSNEKFLSLKAKSKTVESYFNSWNEESIEDSKVYFERRDNQYAGHGINDTKIFDIRTVARAFSAMFLEIPHTAASYPTQIFEQSGDLLFENNQHEIAYYTATLALYKFNRLFNSKKLPGNFGKYRWHTLMLLKYAINGKNNSPQVGSNKIEKYCNKIIDALNKPRDEHLVYFEKCKDIIEQGGWATKDRLKRSLHTNELKEILRKS